MFLFHSLQFSKHLVSFTFVFSVLANLSNVHKFALKMSSCKTSRLNCHKGKIRRTSLRARVSLGLLILMEIKKWGQMRPSKLRSYPCRINCYILSCTDVAQPAEANVSVVFLHEGICHCHYKVVMCLEFTQWKSTQVSDIYRPQNTKTMRDPWTRKRRPQTP